MNDLINQELARKNLSDVVMKLPLIYNLKSICLSEGVDYIG